MSTLRGLFNFSIIFRASLKVEVAHLGIESDTEERLVKLPYFSLNIALTSFNNFFLKFIEKN